MRADFPDQQIGQIGYRVLDLDLDGVCADYLSAFREFCQEQTGLPETSFPAPTHYDLTKSGWPFANLSEYRAMHRAAVEAGIYRRIKPFAGVEESLLTISKASVHIRIVSHRLFVSGLHQRVVTDTAWWLEKYHVPYMSLCLTGLKDTLLSNVIVEDAPYLIDIHRRVGSKVVIFDHQYNDQIPGPRIICWGPSAVDLILDLFESSQGV